MADLRKAARGRECQVRIPGVCNGNPETSVLAHIRLAGLCGTGIKPPDLIATIACSACHDEIDRRTHFVDAGYAILKRLYWHISGWLDCAAPVLNRQTLLPPLHVMPVTTRSTVARILLTLDMQKNARWKVWRERRLSG